jgi:hypothetical protein
LKLFRWLLVVLLFSQTLLWKVWQAEAQAQDAVDLENVVALVDFGQRITFVATVKSPLPVRQASIVILDEAQGTSQVEPLTVETDGRSEFQYDTLQNNLHPFSKVSWSYRFTLPDGTTANSQVYSTRYDDNRFHWQTLESGMLRVHWYGSGDDFGQALLSTVEAGLDSTKRLIPASLDQPVDFYVYASLSDLRGTLVPGSQDWIAGHADPSLGVVMVAIEPGPEQENTMQQRLPHELMHVLLYRALGNAYASIPTWLNEGTASLAELTANTAYDSALQSAISRKDWIRIASLCTSFPDDTSRAFLAYAESRSFVEYIFRSHGSAGLFQLATAYANGASCEEGPQTAFGVPLESLEQDWLASVAGQKVISPDLQNITPYLVLLCLVLLVPMLGVTATLRKKGSHDGTKTEFGK